MSVLARRRHRPVRAGVVLDRHRGDVTTAHGLRLAGLRHDILDGRYRVRPGAVAEAILDRAADGRLGLIWSPREIA